jgi:hypothetical protein
MEREVSANEGFVPLTCTICTIIDESKPSMLCALGENSAMAYTAPTLNSSTTVGHALVYRDSVAVSTGRVPQDNSYKG